MAKYETIAIGFGSSKEWDAASQEIYELLATSGVRLDPGCPHPVNTFGAAGKLVDAVFYVRSAKEAIAVLEPLTRRGIPVIANPAYMR
ncbi:MAG: hypothetical protein WCF77_05295 [Minisyncoccia bacterium]|jgi:hypothetical protein